MNSLTVRVCNIASPTRPIRMQHKHPWSCTRCFVSLLNIQQGPEYPQFLLHSWWCHYTWQFKGEKKTIVMINIFIFWTHICFIQNMAVFTIKTNWFSPPCDNWTSRYVPNGADEWQSQHSDIIPIGKPYVWRHMLQPNNFSSLAQDRSCWRNLVVPCSAAEWWWWRHCAGFAIPSAH